MSSTARFYFGFIIVVACVVAISFYVGYRTGYTTSGHAGAAPVHRSGSRAAP